MSSSTIAPPSQDSRRGELMTRLFSELQKARYNELYYQHRSNWFRWLVTAANSISAVAASAVLASLLVSNGKLFGWGPFVWQILSGIAAVSAAVVPVLHLDDRASDTGKAALGHSIIRNRLQRLLSDLKLSDLDDSHLAREQEIESFGLALAALDEAPSKRLQEECWKQTLEEFPPDQAWTLI